MSSLAIHEPIYPLKQTLNGIGINVMYPPAPLVGCKGDGKTDDTTALQNILNTTGKYGTVIFPLGKQFLISSPLTINNDEMNLIGFADYHGTAAAATDTPGLIFSSSFPTSSTGIVVGSYKIAIRNLYIQGPGMASASAWTGISTSNYIHMEHVKFYNWTTGAALSGSSYYSNFFNCEWINCNQGVNLNGAYNVDLYNPKFNLCNAAIVAANQVRPLSIFGGSIEGFSTGGGINLASGSQCNIYGTYFESSATTGNYGIQMATDCTLNLNSCLIYLTNLNRFVNASGLSGVAINARGNKFISANTSTANPIAYYLPSSGQVDISGDDWTDVPSGYGVYTNNNNALSQPGWRIVPPLNGGFQNIMYMGNAPVYHVLTAPPATPIQYGVYLADGVNWDPLTKASGKPYMVLYSGSAYVPLAG